MAEEDNTQGHLEEEGHVAAPSPAPVAPKHYRRLLILIVVLMTTMFLGMIAMGAIGITLLLKEKGTTTEQVETVEAEGENVAEEIPEAEGEASSESEGSGDGDENNPLAVYLDGLITEEPDEYKKKALYFTTLQEIVLNIEDTTGKMRFMQVEVSIMTRDPATLTAIKIHQSALQNDLLALFSSKGFIEMNSVKGKHALSEEATEITQTTLSDLGVPSKIKAIYFNSFAVQ